MKTTSVDIVIVNWNSGPRLQACLESIDRSVLSTTLINAVHIVDNASNDDSITSAERPARFPRKVIRNAENRGFGRACNQGARHATAELLLFVNPDVVLEEPTIERAGEVMRAAESQGVAACGIKLVDEDGRVARTCARFPTPATMCAHALGLNRAFPRWLPGYVMSEWDHEDTRLVPHIIGAFYMVRRDVFEAVGGFDERFFVYLEDVDLSRRIAATGSRVLYRADIRAFHEGGGSSKQIRARRLYYSVESRLRYARKHFGLAGASCVSVLSLVAEPIVRVIGFAFRGDMVSVRHTLVGYGMLYVSLFRYRRTD